MKIKQQFWIEYLEDYFEKRDILRESDFNSFGELAEMDTKKEIIRVNKNKG